MDDRIRPRTTRVSCVRASWLLRIAVCAGRPHEAREQWMAIERRRGEFRMKLARDEPGMRTQFDELHQAISRESREGQSRRGQLLEIMIVEFIPMPVALEDRLLAVQQVRPRSGHQLRFLGAEA